MFNQQPVRRLYRSRSDRQFSGVSGGIAAYYGIDPTLVRVGWVLATFATFPVAPIIYVVLAMVTPQEPTPETMTGDFMI